MLFLVLGVISGLFIGLIPGMGSMAMFSVLIPFTFTLEPMLAFAMVVGFISVGNTSDSIPAILIGIPGSSSSQATIIDGYAMTRRGEAARALGASFTASILGGLVGVIILSLMIPFIRKFVLIFGAPEFLLLALWGISMVAVLSGKSTIKGLVVGGIGLLLGTIGTDPNLGFPRWTMNSPYLLEGISLALIGLGIFAVPELVSLVVRRSRISEVPLKFTSLRGQMKGAKDVFRHPGVFLKTSSLGTLIGSIPGIGSAVVDWLAYGITTQTSKNKERFGKGDVRGVIGVDGANNATTGGSLIPTLGFGIPGGAATAFLLIVLFTHGVPVGSRLFTNPDSLSLVYFLIWGVAIANIIGGLICFLGAGFLSRITLIPYYYLFALLIPVLFLAAYYTKNNIYFLYILIIFSILGYVFKQLGWPRPPLLIGLVLSRPVEANLGISLNIYGMSWLYRPIVLTILVIIIVGLFFSIRFMRSKPNSELSKSESTETELVSFESKKEMNLYQRFKATGSFLTISLLLILIWGLYQATSWPTDAAKFPLVIGVPILILLLIQLVKDLVPSKNIKNGLHMDISPDLLDKPGEVFKRASIAFSWIIGLLVGVLTLGLALALPIFTFVFLKSVGKVNILGATGLTVLIGFFIFWFGRLANIYWNQGIIISYLFG